MRLSQAMLFVKDFSGMTDFYRDTLGLRAIEDTRLDNWVEFDTGGAKFALHAIPSPIAAGIEISAPPIPREKNPVKLIFEVDDVAGERERLRGLGVTIIERPWGASEAVDPEGNIFQIAPAARA